MMGLLDIFKSNDPSVTQGLLQTGLALLGSRGNFGTALGQAGLQGLQATQQYRDMIERRERAKKQDELLGGQIEQMKRMQEMASLPRKFMTPPIMGVDATGGMDTAESNPNNVSPGRFDNAGYISALRGLDPMAALQYEQATAKTTPQPIKGGPGDVFFDITGKQLFSVPAKPDLTSDQKDYAAAKEQGYQGSFIDYQREMANLKAPKMTQQVNTGQKGFDNTLKLRSDFRSEPIYKAHQDVKSAYAQISASLKQNSPAGDLAGATKIMKILDPGSVVRESELGMAMAASGALDRLVNYADMTIRGTKLTPSQRRDFQNLADKLHQESQRLYNAKRAEYEGIATRNQLNVPDVLGPAEVTNTDGWSIRPKTPQ